MSKRGTLLFVLMFLLVASFAAASHSLSSNIIPVQGMETLTAGLNLTASNFGSVDVVTMLNISAAPLQIISVHDYSGWTELFSPSEIVWKDGTLETNIVQALFDFTATLPAVTADTIYNLTLLSTDDQGFVQSSIVQFVVLDDITGPVLLNAVPNNNSFVRQGTNNQAVQVNATDAETGVQSASFIYGECLSNTTTLALSGAGDIYSSSADLSSFADSDQICFTFESYNNGGTLTQLTGTLTIDGVAPTVVQNSPADGQQINNASQFTFTPADNLAPTLSCDLLIDGAVADSNTFINGALSNFPVTNAAEGPHTWELSCMDLVGLTALSGARNYILDKTPPQIQITGLTNGSFVLNNTIYFADITDNYNIDSIWYDIDGSPFTTNNSMFSISTFGWAEGAHVININANDSANNIASEQFVLILDLTPPTTTLIGPDNVSTDLHINFTINSIDNYASIISCDIYLNGTYAFTGNVSNGVDSIIQRSVLPGDYSWFAICSDGSGNSASSGFSMTFTAVDTSGPDMILTPVSSITRGSSVAVDLNVTDVSGVNFVQANITDADGITTTVTLANAGDLYSGIYTTTAASAAGNYTLTIYSADNVGNPSILTQNFYVDYSYAVTMSLSPSAAYPGNNVAITGTALYDNGSYIPESDITLALPLSNQTLTLVNGSYAYTYTTGALGTYIITATATSLSQGLSYSTMQTLSVVEQPSSGNGGSSRRNSGIISNICGDNICTSLESCSTCEDDCGECEDSEEPSAEQQPVVGMGFNSGVQEDYTKKVPQKYENANLDNGKKNGFGITGMAIGWFYNSGLKDINVKGTSIVMLVLGLIFGLLASLGVFDAGIKKPTQIIGKDIDSYISRLRKPKN